MRIEPITLNAPMWDITPLLPKTDPQPKSIIDILPKPKGINDLFDILMNKLKMEMVLIQFHNNVGVHEESDEVDYSEYLQYPNRGIQMMANVIVDSHDSNDTKMFKIEQWIIENIRYQSDEKTYGKGELWAYPTMTASKGVGDCEDGAFLMHSLALHAGIPADRLRTYGGLVYADQYGISTGGHAWTAYQREVDDEWIIVDWCYWPTDLPLDERNPMSNRHSYIDDWFYVQRDKTVESPYANYVRNPMGLYAHQEKGLLVSVAI